MKILVISNITLNPFLYGPLYQTVQAENTSVKIHFMQSESFLNSDDSFMAYDRLLIWLHFETLFPDLYDKILAGNINAEKEYINIKDYLELWHKKLGRQLGKVLLFSFVSPYRGDFPDIIKFRVDCLVGRMNLLLHQLFHNVLDMHELIMQVGLHDAYDTKNYYRWNSPYSEKLYLSAAESIYSYLFQSEKAAIKCIVLDCDNVLWKGILEESGPKGIQISEESVGRLYRDFQRWMLGLYHQGIILCVCSKNRLEDVLEVFETNSAMVLKKEHITYFAVNWMNKASNIREMSAALHILPKNMLYIDDSPQETFLVSQSLKEIQTITFKKYSIFKELLKYTYFINSDEDSIITRQNTFKTDRLREELKKESQDDDTYLAALKVVIEIKNTNRTEYQRISELSNRANRCTNGVRYDTETISGLTKNETWECYSVYVKDRFSNLGLVGAIGVQSENGAAVLDLFVLSCRALGRRIEEAMLQWLREKYPALTTYSYKTTGYNQSIQELLQNAGYLPNPRC